MADKQILKGTASQIREVFIQDTRQSDGSGLTGLVFNSAGLSAYYMREGAGASTAITLATMTLGTWATGGFVEVDAANLPGLYQIGIPNAALASGANGVTIMLRGAANMAPALVYIHLTAMDPEDGVRGGLTALPNAAAGATGGLGCGVMNGGTAQAGGASTITLAAAAVATDGWYNGEVVNISSGTGAGQARVIKTYVGATRVATVDTAWATNPDNTSVYQVIGTHLAALDSSLQVAANAVNGNVTGSVASVTGAVGSVTGNVGGNVAGTVASVVGAVGSVAAGGITTASFAAGAIDSTIFAQSAANRVLTGAALAELTQAQPPVTPTLAQAVMLSYHALRDTRTITASTDSIQNDAGTVICKAAVSDDGTTFTRAKMVTGP